MQVAGGDRDCSAGVVSAYKAAGLAVSATYTGDMKTAFLATGKFEAWDTRGTTAQRGDVYLNERNHTAMCVDDGTGAYGADMLAEFAINENGGIHGGQVGDQTGNECHIVPYYDYPWDCTLHCTDRDIADRAAYAMEHFAVHDEAHGYTQDMPGRWGDGTVEDIGGPDAPQSGPSNEVSSARTPAMPRYRAYNREHGWLSWMRGLTCECPCEDDFAGEPGCWMYDFQAEGLGDGGWFKILRADGSESINSSGNVNVPITGLVVYFATPDPSFTGYYKAKYQAHWLGAEPGWGKWEFDDEDGGAGKDEDSPLDMVRFTLEKA